MGSANNLIFDPAIRAARQAEKEVKVLKFLRQHIWSIQAILQQVMNLASRQAAHKYLVKMEQQGYLKRHIYDALGGKLTVWGITSYGQSIAFDLETEGFVSSYFEPNRVSEQKINHQLDLQRLRLAAEFAGWRNWIDGDRMGILSKEEKRPDAIVNDMKGRTVACECERTFKSLKRMQFILLSYLKLIKAGKIDHVVWISPTQDISNRMKKIFLSIKYVQVNGQKILIEPDKHHRNLHFCSYSEWPNYYE